MRLKSLAEFDEVKKGEAFEFADKQTRAVRVEIIISQPTIMTVHSDKYNIPVYLSQGTEEIQMVVNGRMALTFDKEVYLHTAEKHTLSKQADGEKYTTIHVAQPRNPEIVAMERRMMENQNARLNQQSKDFEQQLKMLRAEREERNAEKSASVGKVPSNVVDPQPDKPEPTQDGDTPPKTISEPTVEPENTTVNGDG